MLVVVCGLLGNPQQQQQQQLGAATKPLALRPLAACCTVDIQQVLDTPLAVLILDEFLRGKGGGAVEALNFWKGARKFRLTFKAGGPAATCVTPLMACSLCVYLLQPHSLRALVSSLYHVEYRHRRKAKKVVDQFLRGDVPFLAPETVYVNVCVRALTSVPATAHAQLFAGFAVLGLPQYCLVCSCGHNGEHHHGAFI